MAGKKRWIAGAIEHPGALSKSLGVPEEKNIPAEKLAKAAKAAAGSQARQGKTSGKREGRARNSAASARNCSSIASLPAASVCRTETVRGVTDEVRTGANVQTPDLLVAAVPSSAPLPSLSAATAATTKANVAGVHDVMPSSSS